MSATLRVSDFAENPTLFPSPPPVLHVTARQHPVTVHFSRKTHADYLTQAYKKVARIHARLPAGGILVFCTGQNEIVSLVKKLEAKYGKKAIEARKKRAQEMKEREEKRKQGREEWKKARDEAREQAEDEADASYGHIESEAFLTCRMNSVSDSYLAQWVTISKRRTWTSARTTTRT